MHAAATMKDGSNQASSTWHEGELVLQRHAGVDARMADVGRRVVRDRLIDQHRQFYPLLPFVVLGAVDEAGDVWATLRAGQPGFLRAPDDRHLHLDLASDPADPAAGGFKDGDAIAKASTHAPTLRVKRFIA